MTIFLPRNTSNSNKLPKLFSKNKTNKKNETGRYYQPFQNRQVDSIPNQSKPIENLNPNKTNIIQVQQKSKQGTIFDV